MKSNKFKAVFIPENSEKLSKGTQPMKHDIKKGDSSVSKKIKVTVSGDMDSIKSTGKKKASAKKL